MKAYLIKKYGLPQTRVLPIVQLFKELQVSDETEKDLLREQYGEFLSFREFCKAIEHFLWQEDYLRNM